MDYQCHQVFFFVFKSCKSAYTVLDCKGANLNLMSCEIFLIIYGFCLKKSYIIRMRETIICNLLPKSIFVK